MPLEDGGGTGVVTGESRGHVDLQREPGRGRVDVRPDDADDAGLLQRADPVLGRGGRQAGKPRELDVGPIGIGLQLGQQQKINFVKFDSHITKFYSVYDGDCQILAQAGGTLGS